MKSSSHSAPTTGANPELLRGLLIISAVVSALLLVLYATTLHLQDGWVREANGFVLGRDFLNFWMAGRAAWEAHPERFYDPETYTAALQQMLGGRYMQQWSYPPVLLLLAAPFGLLPYHLAYALWTGLGLTALWCAAKLRAADRVRRWALLLSPAALLCLLCGQNAFFSAAAILAIYHWRTTRPVLAGLLLGLLTCKPQLGLLFPLVLLAERNWRCIGVATLTALMLAAATSAMFGMELWRAYIDIGVPAQSLVLREPAAMIAALMPTPFIQFWMLGMGYHPAMLLQALLGIAMAVITYRVFRRAGNADVKFLLFCIASLLATPYLLSYDLLALSFACVTIAHAQPLQKNEQVALALTFFLPFVQILAMLPNMPVTLLPVITLGWFGWRRLA